MCVLNALCKGVSLTLSDMNSKRHRFPHVWSDLVPSTEFLKECKNKMYTAISNLKLHIIHRKGSKNYWPIYFPHVIYSYSVWIMVHTMKIYQVQSYPLIRLDLSFYYCKWNVELWTDIEAKRKWQKGQKDRPAKKYPKSSENWQNVVTIPMPQRKSTTAVL